LVAAKRLLITDRGKQIFLKVFGLLTFFLHTSVLWVDYLKNGSATVADNILFPIYFCNCSMYMLLIVAFMERRNTKWFRYFATVTAYAGIFGSLISLFYPAYYLGATSIFEWGVFKSMLSHSTMLIGCSWLLVGGFAPIQKNNAFVYSVGLLGFGLIGLIVNGLFRIAGLNDPNAMYLSHPPLAEAPFLSAYTIAVLMVVLIYLFTRVYATFMEKAKNTNSAIEKRIPA
jgi:hypothetical protein